MMISALNESLYAIGIPERDDQKRVQAVFSAKSSSLRPHYYISRLTGCTHPYVQLIPFLVPLGTGFNTA